MNKFKNLRQIGYGAAGLTIGVIVYLLFSTNAPMTTDVRSTLPEFTSMNDDFEQEYVTDEEYTGDIVPMFPHGSYRVSQADFDEYERLGVITYGKVNPTFYFDMPAAAPEDEEGQKETEKKKQSRQQAPLVEVENNSATNTSRENNNALISAKKYIDLGTGFSKNGLRDQLEFEKYSESAINYALNNINVDYNEQAYLSAKNYENADMGFSDKSLIDQLIFEGFSDSQAKYGVDKLNGSLGNDTGGRIAKIIDGFNIHTTKTEKFNVEDIRNEFAENAVFPVDIEYLNISSDFGVRQDPFTKSRAFHAGVDFSQKGIEGANIYSVLDGEVVESVTNFGDDGLGNYVVIDHGEFHTLYAHMLEAPELKEGDVVQAGDVVGSVGSTGRSTGPHLHFEVGVGGIKFDGLEFLIDIVDKNDDGRVTVEEAEQAGFTGTISRDHWLHPYMTNGN